MCDQDLEFPPYTANQDQRQQLADAQDEDDIIGEVKRMVKRNIRPPKKYFNGFFRANFHRFVIEEAVLYRKARIGPAGTNVLQAIIPGKLKASILEDVLGDVFSDHPGHKNLFQKLLNHAVWPGISKDVKHYVKLCSEQKGSSKSTPNTLENKSLARKAVTFENTKNEPLHQPLFAESSGSGNSVLGVHDTHTDNLEKESSDLVRHFPFYGEKEAQGPSDIVGIPSANTHDTVSSLDSSDLSSDFKQDGIDNNNHSSPILERMPKQPPQDLDGQDMEDSLVLHLELQSHKNGVGSSALPLDH